jgi:hypothetical protein
MARPIRDFQTETARSGDATRAYGRFGDGSDWLQAGITAMERAGNEIGRVISERVEQANRLEDATVRSEAIQKTRLRLDERLRGLDPRAPEYSSEVERALSETIQSVVSETNWRTSSTRAQFLIDAAQLRTQTILSAADQRERAVVNAAKEQVDTALGRAVAAIAQTPGTRDVQLLQLENEIGPILANIRPEVRDAIIKQVREVTAEEAVRNFIISRNFAAAEQALQVYGGQGLISPMAVRQIRAGLQAEKRQAAAEARAATQSAVFDIRNLFLETLVDEGNRALRAALDSGVIRRGSNEHAMLEAMSRNVAAKLRDRGTEAFNEAVERLQSGVGTTADETQVVQALLRQARVSARERLEALGPEAVANPEVVERVRMEEAQRAQERAVQVLIDLRPDKVPEALERMVDAAALNPDRRAALGEFLERLRQRSPGVVERVLRQDPVLSVAMDDARASGESTTQQALQARLSRMSRQPRSEEEWKKETGGTSPALRPDRVLAEAEKKLIPADEIRQVFTPEQRDRLLEDFKRAWMAGYDPQTAAHFAVRRMLGDTHVSQAATQPVRLRREDAPATYFPMAALAGFDVKTIETQIVNRVITAMVDAMKARDPNITEEKVRRQYNVLVTAMPVLVDGQPRTAFVAHRQNKAPGSPMLQINTASGQPWQFIVPVGDPAQVRAAFDAAFKLTEARTLLEQNPSRGSVSEIQRRQQIREQALERTEELRRMDQIIRRAQERGGTLITPGPAQRR